MRRRDSGMQPSSLPVGRRYVSSPAPPSASPIQRARMASPPPPTRRRQPTDAPAGGTLGHPAKRLPDLARARPAEDELQVPGDQQPAERRRVLVQIGRMVQHVPQPRNRSARPRSGPGTGNGCVVFSMTRASTRSTRPQPNEPCRDHRADDPAQVLHPGPHRIPLGLLVDLEHGVVASTSPVRRVAVGHDQRRRRSARSGPAKSSSPSTAPASTCPVRRR